MLVSFPAGMLGQPMDDSNVIEMLIRQHQTDLALTHIIETTTRQPPDLKSMHYWIGKYRPDQYHAVELISPDNLARFEQQLQQERLYLPEQRVNRRPAMLIFSDKLNCHSTSYTLLKSLSLPVLQSPLPARTVMRTLAYSRAEREQSLTQHGVMLSIDGEGILISGESGLGKSGIGLELVSRGHRLVADDAPLLHRPPQSRHVFAVSSPLLADLLDVRGAGVLDISKLFGERATQAIARLDLIIELVKHYPPVGEASLSPFNTRTNILGLDLPRLQVPISHSTNPAVLIETITRNHVLYRNGHDANARLSERQRQYIEKQNQ